MKITIYRGAFVDCPSLGEVRILHDHVCVVNEEGFIIEFRPYSPQEPFLSSGEVEEISIENGSFLIPTFVDLHLHAPQYLYQGTGLHLPLMEWLDKYAYRAEERIDADPILAKNVYASLAAHLLEQGTGAVLLFGTISEEANLILAKEMLDAGIRAFVGKLSMDISSRPTYVEASAQEALNSARSFINRTQELVHALPIQERLVEPVITPRFVPTCSDALLHGLGALAKETGVRVQSHLSEARDMLDYIQQSRGMSDIDIFDQAGLLSGRSVQVHCTYLTSPSLRLLADRGTSVAHCPLSNAYFSGKPFPLREALTEGVRTGLGSDIAGGYTADILAASRSTVMVSRMREGDRQEALYSNGLERAACQDNLSVSWKDALFLATRGGAAALGLDIGTFGVGAPFDAQKIRLVKENKGVGNLRFHDESDLVKPVEEEMLEKWWCLGDIRNRQAVWVQGKCRYDSSV